MHQLGFTKFTFKYFICATNLKLVHIAGPSRPGLRFLLLPGYQSRVSGICYRPDRDGQFQLAAGCLVLDFISPSWPMGDWQFQLAAG